MARLASLVPPADLEALEAEAAAISTASGRLWIVVVVDGDGFVVEQQGSAHRLLDPARCDELDRRDEEIRRQAERRLQRTAESTGGFYRRNANGTTTVRLGRALGLSTLAAVLHRGLVAAPAYIARPASGARRARGRRRSSGTRRASASGRQRPRRQADPEHKHDDRVVRGRLLALEGSS